jgi:hypothetical protein
VTNGLRWSDAGRASHVDDECTRLILSFGTCLWPLSGHLRRASATSTSAGPNRFGASRSHSKTGLGHEHVVLRRAKEVLVIADTTTITVIELRTGEILSHHDIVPTRSYWCNKQRSPGRWPGLRVT